MTVNGESDRGQSQLRDSVTVSAARVDGVEAIMPTGTRTAGTDGDPMERQRVRQYVAPMTLSANTVIAAIDQERPGLSQTKRDLLMFFCQGHHLGWHDIPLFAEPIYATGEGVTVTRDDSLTDTFVDDLKSDQLNAVTYTLSRYGNLSPADLRTLVQASQPWQSACRSADHRIEWAWLIDWFRRPDEQNDPADDRPTADMVAAFTAKYPEAGRRP